MYQRTAKILDPQCTLSSLQVQVVDETALPPKHHSFVRQAGALGLLPLHCKLNTESKLAAFQEGVAPLTRVL